ncbi:FAD:protein FMN transferase [Pelagicoccus sp. SDUM812003]|uniref:FAD:protein FMN transferase n=1 Tax=Pelagicoccus sp. SDUM812003 TaxID=3041267 RepID=UPI00280CF1F9|nr:FAD:protein FMN transferase [Pelagicoccus sp. SDUM812003]MDQ8205089.1 FAD:protein FMN transferase [Pelagicoccus sp. SDUM812003]
MTTTSQSPKLATARLRYTPETQLYDLSFKAMGTLCRILFQASDNEHASVFAQSAYQWVSHFESKYSRFLPHSLISQINASAGRSAVALDREASQLLDLAGAIASSTNGLIDATSLPLIRLWDYHLKDRKPPTESQIEQARELVGWDKVNKWSDAIELTVPGMALDLGGFGKEWAVDRVAELAVAHGIRNGLVDFGRDIRVLGTPPNRPAWHVAIEDPNTPQIPYASLAATDMAIATSNNSIRKFTYQGKQYGHIIDPRTGRPADTRTRSATVIAASALQAGLLATQSMMLSPEAAFERIEEDFGSEGILLLPNKEMITSGAYQTLVFDPNQTQP